MPFHPDDLVLATWLDGATKPPAAATDHVTHCPTCQERLAVLAAEARDWRAALTLTGGELSYLRQADLPGQLIDAVAMSAAVVRIGAGARQLALLLALALSVAVAWALLAPWLDEALLWLDYLVDVPTLTVLLLAQAAVVFAGGLVALADDPVPLLLSQAALLATVLVLGVAWWRRPRQLSPITG
ncbi:MAG: hypothetical protein IT340_00415 [Chloroflexi bacterium]|nr:hypothetical protein [Chloroflexota bacterium]